MKVLAGVLISLAAYATGAVIVRRRSASRFSAPVQPVEVLAVSALLVAVGFLWHRNGPHVYRLLCAGAMFFIGAAVTRAALAAQGRVGAGTREFDYAGEQEPATSLWKRWLNFSRAVIDYEFRLILVACYILIVGPIAMAFRLRRQAPIGTDSTSTWTPRATTPSLDAARRQF